MNEPKKPPSYPTQVGPKKGSETQSTHNESFARDAAADASGQARPRVEPQLPHEIDESSHSQASASARHIDIGNQAMKDELSPSMDTDKGPVLDEVYNRQLADRDDGPPRQ